MLEVYLAHTCLKLSFKIHLKFLTIPLEILLARPIEFLNPNKFSSFL
ncbi:hypothetical protein APA_816 [Pseudanabaena sp. lw0831]|nr:hypothetical protein APA_816 [Pseudanabaena sp. lw0831]